MSGVVIGHPCLSDSVSLKKVPSCINCPFAIMIEGLVQNNATISQARDG